MEKATLIAADQERAIVYNALVANAVALRDVAALQHNAYVCTRNALLTAISNGMIYRYGIGRGFTRRYHQVLLTAR